MPKSPTPNPFDQDRKTELITLVCERSVNLADLILKGVYATMEHNRPSVVNLVVKIARNQDDPRLIEVTAQEKIKAPKSKYSDLNSWDEVDLLKAYRIGDESGQQVLPMADLAAASVERLRGFLEEHGATITIESGGESATIGGKRR